MTANRNTKGFSLIELLCALTIGMIMLSALGELFISYKKTTDLTHAISTMQEHMRFLSHYMRHYITQTGYTGCSHLYESFHPWDHALSIYQGNGSGWLPVLPHGFRFKPRENSDVIEIHFMNNKTAGLFNEVFKDDERLHVESSPIFKAGQSMMIADCLHAEIVRIQSVYLSKAKHYQSLTLQTPIHFSFGHLAEVGQMKTMIFYIGKTSRKNKLKQPIYALYQVDERGRKTELVSGIYDLKVTLYQKKSHELLTPEPGAIRNWHNVVGIRVDLLLRSRENVLQRAKTYWFNGVFYMPSDHRLYQSVQLFFPLYNRVVLS